jgi:hypothetical protein
MEVKDFEYTINTIQSRLAEKFPGYAFTVAVTGEDVDITADPPLTDEQWRDAMALWGIEPAEYWTEMTEGGVL